MNGQTPRTEPSGDDGHALRARSHTPPPVGTVEWERAGGPPLSFGQKLSLLGGAREARRIAKDAGWDEARQDRMAVAITTNLNAFVPLNEFGPEAHFMSVGGLVEVIAQEWKVHPENLAEILERFPRDGFTDEALQLVQREVKQNPGGRFACLNPLFPMMVRRSAFSQEATRR